MVFAFTAAERSPLGAGAAATVTVVGCYATRRAIKSVQETLRLPEAAVPGRFFAEPGTCRVARSNKSAAEPEARQRKQATRLM